MKDDVSKSSSAHYSTSKAYEENYERIYGKRETKCEKCDHAPCECNKK